MKNKAKGNKKRSTSQKKSQEKSEEEKQVEERTFSDWLCSEEGIETVKLFVFGNTILIFLVVSWPYIKETLDSVYYLYLDYIQKK